MKAIIFLAAVIAAYVAFLAVIVGPTLALLDRFIFKPLELDAWGEV